MIQKRIQIPKTSRKHSQKPAQNRFEIDIEKNAENERRIHPKARRRQRPRQRQHAQNTATRAPTRKRNCAQRKKLREAKQYHGINTNAQINAIENK